MIYEQTKNLYALRRTYTLANTDREVLARLYLPIIGYEALALYNYFDNILPSVGVKRGMIKDIYNDLHMNPTIFLRARSMLEAMRLLKTYYKKADEGKEDEFLFSLASPLEPEKFFKNPAFPAILKKQLNDACRYNELRRTFMIGSDIDSRFTDISVQIWDVFTIDDKFFMEEDEEKEDSYLRRIEDEHENFDVDKFVSIFLNNNPMLTRKDIEADLDFVKLYANLYGVSEERASVVFDRSFLSTSNTFNRKAFLKDIRDLSILSDVPEEFGDVMAVIGDSKSSKKLELFNKISPATLVYHLTDKQPLLPSDFELIEALRDRNDLSIGVINVIIDATITKTGGKLSRAYAEKLARSIVFNNANRNTFEAYSYIYNDNEKFLTKNTKSKRLNSYKKKDQETKSKKINTFDEDDDLDGIVLPDLEVF